MCKKNVVLMGQNDITNAEADIIWEEIILRSATSSHGIGNAGLIHSERDKIADTLQTTFSKTCFSLRKFGFRLKFD